MRSALMPNPAVQGTLRDKGSRSVPDLKRYVAQR